MNITVVGMGYVGLSNAVLLAQYNHVRALEIIPEKVELINQKKSPIVDKEIEEYLATKELNLIATTEKEFAYEETELVLIAAPTNYDDKKNFFDTSLVEVVIEDVLKYAPKATMIIKSTVPVASKRNQIPRKSLNYQTPLEVFLSYINEWELSNLI